MAVTAHADEELLVVFRLAGEDYGVDVARVHEINQAPQITRVPGAPPFVEGVINLRGRVIPVVDLRRRFGLPTGERTRDTRIVVAEVAGQTIGMLVDSVTEVLRIAQAQVEPPSPLVATIESDYLRGIAKLPDRLVILLDVDRILTLAERSALGEFAA